MKTIPLYWTMATILGFISLMPIAFGFIVCLYFYIKQRYQHILFLTMALFASTLAILFNTLSYLLLSVLFFRLALFVVGIGWIFFVIFLDSIVRESLSPWKITPFAMMQTALTIFLFLFPDDVYQAPFPGGVVDGIFQRGNVLLINMFFYGAGGLLLIYYATKIFLNAPRALKLYATIYLLGVLVAVVGVLVVGYLRLPLIIPGIHLIPTGIGFFFMSISFAFQLKIAFILPFKALRLTVIETQSGITLYNHTWSKMDNLVDPELFAGMLQGISTVLDESLKRGNIQEIKLDRATLLLEQSREYPIACFLIATKSTRSLQHALRSFAERFFTEYSPYFTNPSATHNFESALRLVEERFAFVPVYE